MNKLAFFIIILCLTPAFAWAQAPVGEELPAIIGTQTNSASTILQDVVVEQKATQQVTPPLTPTTAPQTATIDDVINNVVNDNTTLPVEDTSALGAAPAAALPVDAATEEPVAELEDEPMTPQKFAILGTLDKVTGRTATLEVPVDKVTNFGALFLQVKACQKASAFANQPENAAFVQMWQAADAGLNSKATIWVFSGWMFSSSPSLSAMDHPVYDVWVIDCKNMAKNTQSK